jgi:hypothetical protein
MKKKETIGRTFARSGRELVGKTQSSPLPGVLCYPPDFLSIGHFYNFSLTSNFLSYIMYYTFMPREVVYHAVEHQTG